MTTFTYTLTRKAWALMTENRCEVSDLPVGTCGDACCRPDLHAADLDLPHAVPGSRRGAIRSSMCPQCGHRIFRGETIAKTIENLGVGHWVHEGCTIEGNRS